VSKATHHHVRKSTVAAAAAIALATALAAAGTVPVATLSPTPVVFDYWHGSHFSAHLYGAIRPTWLGGSFGPAISGLSWQSWGSGSASGEGEIFQTICQPCRVAIEFSGATRWHGSLYFGKERVTDYLGRSASTVSLHWSWSSGNYV
jgi:hypothetical protein